MVTSHKNHHSLPLSFKFDCKALLQLVQQSHSKDVVKEEQETWDTHSPPIHPPPPASPFLSMIQLPSRERVHTTNEQGNYHDNMAMTDPYHDDTDTSTCNTTRSPIMNASLFTTSTTTSESKQQQQQQSPFPFCSTSSPSSSLSPSNQKGLFFDWKFPKLGPFHVGGTTNNHNNSSNNIHKQQQQHSYTTTIEKNKPIVDSPTGGFLNLLRNKQQQREDSHPNAITSEKNMASSIPSATTTTTTCKKEECYLLVANTSNTIAAQLIYIQADSNLIQEAEDADNNNSNQSIVDSSTFPPPILIWQSKMKLSSTLESCKEEEEEEKDDDVILTTNCTLVLKDFYHHSTSSTISNNNYNNNSSIGTSSVHDAKKLVVQENQAKEEQGGRKVDLEEKNLMYPTNKIRYVVAIVVGTSKGQIFSFQLHIMHDSNSTSSSSSIVSSSPDRSHFNSAIHNNNTDTTSPRHGLYYQLQLPSSMDEMYIEPLLHSCIIEDTTNNSMQRRMNNTNHTRIQSSTLHTTTTAHTFTVPKRKRSRNHFTSHGSILSIQAYYNFQLSYKSKGRDTSSFIWITFTDGTMIRILDTLLFYKRTCLNKKNDNTMHDNALSTNGGIKLIRPSSSSGLINQMYIPCPRSFPTIVSPTLIDDIVDHSFTYDTGVDDDDDDDKKKESLFHGDDYNIIHPWEFFEAISFSKEITKGEGGGDKYHHLPTLLFYSSEDQSINHSSISWTEIPSKENPMYMNRGEHGDTFIDIVKSTSSSILGGTASIAKGVFGGIMGKILSSSSTIALGPASEMDSNSYQHAELEGSTLRRQTNDYDLIPIEVSLATCLYDTPRKVIDLSIDPIGGTLAATADNLGRVQLIDLTTKQVIRIWKNCRDAVCHWMTCNSNDINSMPMLYLVIHSRLRNVVEIYRTRHGPREATIPIQSHDTYLLQCPAFDNENDLSMKCFVVSPRDNFIQSIVLKQAEAQILPRSTMKKLEIFPMVPNVGSESSIQLRLLQQLLTTDITSGFSSDPSTVLDAFKAITAINDTIKAMSILATASVLEDYMGTNGSSFHRSIISHTEMRIDQMKANGAAFTTSNDHLVEISLTVAIHKQVVAAYDVISKFEEEFQITAIPNDSTEKDEAQDWIQTFEDVTKTCVDAKVQVDDEMDKMKFATFAKCCLQSSHETELTGFPIKIFLCDSTKDRNKVLTHIFRPLICDVFSMKAVREVFEYLGIYRDREILLRYFGEWFMCLRLNKVNVNDLFRDGSATVRFLEAIIQEDANNLIRAKSADIPTLLLGDIRLFCSKSEDLLRAFLLAQTCYKAIASASKQLEEKTYGTIQQINCVKPWIALLSKLRICLLISLRMSYIPSTSFPITVDNVEDGTIFSIFEWIAQDELRITHNQEELLSLEKICESIKDIDHEGKCRAMQQACVEGSSKISPLLYFLRHYNSKPFLAAHRALILADMWGRAPENLELMVDAMDAIRILDTGRTHQKQYSMVARAEIWNNQLRPIYRALFYGFDQVYEVNEDSISHLITNRLWLREVVRISLDLLKPLDKLDRRADPPKLADFGDPSFTTSDLWPPLKDDCTLQGLSRKWNNSHFNILADHRGILCSLQLTSDLDRIKACFPNLDEMFLSILHMKKVPLTFETNGAVREKRGQFIIQALHLKAESSDLALDEVIYLGTLFGLSKDFVFTTFVICMYELGKDDEVDDLVAASGRLLNIPEFLDGCIDVVAVRLSVILNILKREKHYRIILSSLDADTCQFVHELSAKTNVARPIIDDDSMIRTLSSCHFLTLRMIRLSAQFRKAEIQSLSILSGTLLKAVQQIA